MGSHNQFYKKKIRKGKELARRQGTKAPYETIFIICEDSKSVPYYLNECRKHLKLNTANVVVLPGKGSAPISIVEHAIELAINTPEIDTIACVFDRDDHESYDRALDKIKQHKPKKSDKSKPKYLTITSTPCFELWLLLHFQYTTKGYNSAGHKSAANQILKDLRKIFRLYTKNGTNWFHSLVNKTEHAIKNAKQLAAHNLRTNSNNPATNFHLLIEILMNLKPVS